MDDVLLKINDIIDLHAVTMRERYTDNLSVLLDSCESPIERILGAALLHDLLSCPEFGFEFIEDATNWRLVDGMGALFCQHIIGPYRVDFFVSFETKKGPIEIVIECDGHDFHERTKEQARRDKAKDRWFQVRGFVVLRFTGSEIWNDPVKCAEHVLKVIWNRLSV